MIEQKIEIIEIYGKEWKLMQLSFGEKPMTFMGWINLIKGFDIWIGPIPLLKTIIITNLIMWILLWAFS